MTNKSDLPLTSDSECRPDSGREIVRVEVATLIDHNIRSQVIEDAELIRLAENMQAVGQLDPIRITKALKIKKGHRRVAAAKRNRWTHIDAIIDEDGTPEQILEEQLIEVCHSLDLSSYDRAVAFKTLKESRGWGNKQLADFLKIDPAASTQYLSLFVCPARAIEAARLGKIGPKKWYKIARAADKEKAADLVLGKGTETEQSERITQTNVKLPLTKGTLTVRGKAIDLSDLIALLREALGHALDAAGDGLNIKTFEDVVGDKAKNGFKPARKNSRRKTEAAEA